MAFMLAALICLGGVSTARAGGPGGSIEDSQGKTTQVLEFLNLLPAFYFSLNDAEQSAPMRDIQSLTWLGGGQIKLANNKGQSFTVLGAMQINTGEMILIRAKDPVTGRSAKAEIDPLLVKTITFAWPK